MRHQKYNENYPFVIKPIEFDKYTDISLLRYALGATMYMPGTKDFLQAIIDKKYPGLTTMVMCFEDACKLEDVPAAEENCLHLLEALDQKVKSGELLYEEIPLIIFRVRNLEQFKHFTSRLTKDMVHFITAFNFPKFNSTNGEGYYAHLKELTERFDSLILDMKELEYISSAGLRILKRAYMAMRRKEGSLKLKNVNKMVMEVFEVTGFAGLLQFI